MKRMVFGDLALPSFDRELCVNWIESLPENNWFWNEYRQCHMLPLMTKTGGFNEKDTFHPNQKISEFFWTSCANNYIKNYFESHVFNWTGTRSRIVVIRTQSEKEMPVHIDCSPTDFHLTQHKFRIVVRGNTNRLYFMTQQGPVWAPLTERPFIIDGAWPHGMSNNMDQTRYTICLGAPWTQSKDYPGLQTLLSLDEEQMPKQVNHLFHPRHQYE